MPISARLELMDKQKKENAKEAIFQNSTANSDKTSDTKVIIEDQSKKKKKKKKKDQNLDAEEAPQQEDPEILALKEKVSRV